ncbi:MAG: hypothetical protein IJ759_05895 [Bacteroidales bacterium]|nr:hypothetical protein [Bacteroidales bacterium]
MRVRVKISINDAENVCKFLLTMANNTDAVLIKQQTHIDYIKLYNHLVLMNRGNGRKITSFTLDGLTLVMMKMSSEKYLDKWFDEPHQYMMRYAIEQTWHSAENYLQKMKLKI